MTKYSKGTQRHTVVPMKEKKTYWYINDLIEDVMLKREFTDERLDTSKKVKPEDPINIQPTIAQVPRPPKTELIELHKKRF